MSLLSCNVNRILGVGHRVICDSLKFVSFAVTVDDPYFSLYKVSRLSDPVRSVDPTTSVR